MGRIVSNFFISLDGVVESPDQWHFPYFDDAMGAIVGEGMGTISAMLMGRKLYDEWSEYWPGPGPGRPVLGVHQHHPQVRAVHHARGPDVAEHDGPVRRRRRRAAGGQGQHRRRHRDVRQRHHRALAARERPARRARPAGAPDRRRVGPATLRGHAHVPARAAVQHRAQVQACSTCATRLPPDPPTSRWRSSGAGTPACIDGSAAYYAHGRMAYPERSRRRWPRLSS